MQTVDLQNAVDEAEDRIAEIKRESQDLDPDSEEYEKLDAQFGELMARVETFEEKIEEWGGSEFVIGKLDYGQMMQAKDEVHQASFDLDTQTGDVDGVPRDGFYRIKVLELSLVDQPPGAPEHPKDLPLQVGEWLYDRVDEYNTRSEASLKDFSLEEQTDRA